MTDIDRVREIVTTGEVTRTEAKRLAEDWLALTNAIDEAQIKILELGRERDRLAIEVDAQRQRADNAEEDIVSLQRDEEFIWRQYRDARQAARLLAWDMYAAEISPCDGVTRPEHAAQWADGLLAERDKRWPVEVKPC